MKRILFVCATLIGSLFVGASPAVAHGNGSNTLGAYGCAIYTSWTDAPTHSFAILDAVVEGYSDQATCDGAYIKLYACLGDGTCGAGTTFWDSGWASSTAFPAYYGWAFGWYPWYNYDNHWAHIQVSGAANTVKLYGVRVNICLQQTSSNCVTYGKVWNGGWYTVCYGYKCG